MRKIDATGGWLHYPPLEFYYMQGEVNVEPVQFVLPKTRKEVDLTALSYQRITAPRRRGLSQSA